MRLDTVVYLEKNNKILMLYRNKKENDINFGKYIGVGGKFEKNETPYECAIREVKEETGYTVNKLDYRGLLSFALDEDEMLYIFVFSSKDFTGNQINCTEGTLKWVDKSEILKLNIWDGDRVFLEKIQNDDYVPFMIKNVYKKDKLIEGRVEI